MELVYAELFKDFRISVKCNFQKARILRKQNNYEGSKVYITQAIAICKHLGDKKKALKCELFLGDMSWERYSEALYVFIKALIEQRETWQESGKVMASIQKLHLEMNESSKMVEIILTSSIIGQLRKGAR